METPEDKYLSKNELMGNIRFEKNFTRMGAIGCLPVIALVVVLALTVDDPVTVALILIPTMLLFEVVGSLIWRRKYGDSKGLNEMQMSTQILHAALTERFLNVELQPNTGISEELLRRTGFPFTKNSRVCESANRATAVSVVTPIEACQVRFGNYRNIQSTDNMGRDYTSRVLDENFDGMFYICHLGRPFCPVTLWTRRRKQTGGVPTGDQVFDRLFILETQQPGCLTAGMRQFLVNWAGKFKQDFYIQFSASGDLYLAFNQKVYNAIDKNPTEPFENLENQFGLVTGLINGLNGGF